MHSKRSVLTSGACAFAALAIIACVDGRADFDRHAMSRIWVPEHGDEIIFEASVSPRYPEASATADATRERWLAAWLAQRDLCPDGYRIVERRRFAPGDDNPYTHDLRYRVACADGG